MIKCNVCKGNGQIQVIIDNTCEMKICRTCNGIGHTPGLVGKTLFFTTGDGLTWELGAIVEEFNGAFNGGWAFRVENDNGNTVFGDVRDNERFSIQ